VRPVLCGVDAVARLAAYVVAVVARHFCPRTRELGVQAEGAGPRVYGAGVVAE
jgi:hypothetical protein